MKATKLFFFLIFLSFFFISYFPSLAKEQEFFCSSDFTDIEDDTILCHYVNFLDFNRVVSGYSDHTYRQEDKVTREQFAKYIVNSFEISEDISTLTEEEVFPDVPDSNKFFSYIHILKKAGIISGFPDGEYKPGEELNRGAAMKFIVNAANSTGKTPFELEAEVNFEDVSKEHSFYTYISRGVKASAGKHKYNQITNPENPKYRPADSVTREELAKMIVNAMVFAESHPNSNFIDLEQAIKGIVPSFEEEENGIEYRNFEDLGIKTVSTDKEFDFIYKPIDSPNIYDYGKREGYEVLVNGSYFGGYYETIYEDPPSYDENKDYVRVFGTGAYLNVRESASTEAEIIAKLYDGEIVEELLKQGKWFKVRYDENITGWISSEFSEEFDPTSLFEGVFAQVQNTGSYLRVREDKSEESIEIGRFYDGDVLDVLETRESWKYVAAKDIEGWVSSEYLVTIDGQTAYRERNKRRVLNRVHAGYLKQDGEELTPLKTRNETNQLTHVVEVSNKITMIDVDSFSSAAMISDNLQFQTGPLMIKNNQIRQDYIFNSKNGRGKHKRTAMVVDSEGVITFVIVEKEMSLSELSHTLIHFDFLKGKTIDMINLDGGSSTALFSEEYSEMNYGTEKSLPILIGIK